MFQICNKHIHRNCPNRASVVAAAAAAVTFVNQNEVNRFMGHINNDHLGVIIESVEGMRLVSVSLVCNDLKCDKFTIVFSLFDSGRPQCFV